MQKVNIVIGIRNIFNVFPRPLTFTLFLSTFAIVCLGYCSIKFYSRLQPCVSLNTNSPQTTFNSKQQAVMEGLELTEFNQGVKVFTLKAKQLYLRNKKVEPFGFRIALGKTAELEDVNMAFYANGEPVSFLYSNKATLDKKNKNIIFQGRPSMLTKNHRALTAKQIKWDNASQSIQAQGNCVLSGDGMEHRAETIKADVNLNNFSKM